MLSIFMRARSFSPEKWKKGEVVNFPIVDGNGKDPARLVYRGKSKVRADNGVTYAVSVSPIMSTRRGSGRR